MTTKKISKIHQRVMSASTATRNINKMIENSIESIGDDSDFFKDNPAQWEELEELASSLREGVLTFADQMNSMVTNEEAMALLQDKKPEFDRMFQTYLSDTKDFSEKFAQLYTKHEGRSGKITNMEDYALFNSLAFQYEHAKDELSALLAPTISEMVLLINSQYTKQQQQAKAQADLTNPDVVSDVEVKTQD